MCGIVFGFSKKQKKISKSVMKKYTNQKHRGSNGYGYVAIYKDKFNVGRSLDEAGIRTQIMNESSGMILFHHRMPTSTANVLEATHPIWVEHDELDHNYFVVHNGVIRNCDELKKKHEALKYVYGTTIETEVVSHHVAKKTGSKYFSSVSKTEKYNDSESLAIEVARCLDGMKHTIDAVGTIAFIAYKFEKETNKLLSISYGHNSGNPLTIIDNNDHFFLVSLGGVEVKEDVLFTLNVSGENFGKTSEKDMKIGYISEFSKNGGYTQDTNRTTHSTHGVTAKKDDIVDPALPFPKNGIRREITPYKKNPKGVYETAEDYFEDKMGFNREKQLHWDKEDKNIRTSMGFRLNDNPTDIDTTTEDINFAEVSSFYVKQYLEYEDELLSAKADIDTAEYMLIDPKIDKRSKDMLVKEVKAYELQTEAIQQKMNEVEDAYCDEVGNSIPFSTLLDAYKEQIESDFEGDIQMEDMEGMMEELQDRLDEERADRELANVV